MEEVNELLELAMLYDFYGELLNEHQRQIYEDFVLNDLSLAEIDSEEGISRQGVHDLIKRCDKTLQGYEEKLHLVEKFLKATKLDNLCVTGTKIGEQAYLISNLSSPIFFVVGDIETAFKAQQQLIALNL